MSHFDNSLRHVMSLPELANDERVMRLCIAHPDNSAEILRRLTLPEELPAWQEINERDALGASLYFEFPKRITVRGVRGRYFQFIVPPPPEVSEPQHGK